MTKAGLLALLSLLANVSLMAQTQRRVYFFTATPIQIEEFMQCVAVDLSDPSGVWTYSPGLLECGSRTTGPGLYHPEGASITPGAGGAIEVRYRMQRIVGNPAWFEVQLIIRDGHLHSESGARVPVEQREKLYVPADDELRSRPAVLREPGIWRDLIDAMIRRK